MNFFNTGYLYCHSCEICKYLNRHWTREFIAHLWCQQGWNTFRLYFDTMLSAARVEYSLYFAIGWCLWEATTDWLLTHVSTSRAGDTDPLLSSGTATHTRGDPCLETDPTKKETNHAIRRASRSVRPILYSSWLNWWFIHWGTGSHLLDWPVVFGGKYFFSQPTLGCFPFIPEIVEEKPIQCVEVTSPFLNYKVSPVPIPKDMWAYFSLDPIISKVWIKLTIIIQILQYQTFSEETICPVRNLSCFKYRGLQSCMSPRSCQTGQSWHQFLEQCFSSSHRPRSAIERGSTRVSSRPGTANVAAIEEADENVQDVDQHPTPRITKGDEPGPTKMEDVIKPEVAAIYQCVI